MQCAKLKLVYCWQVGTAVILTFTNRIIRAPFLPRRHFSASADSEIFVLGKSGHCRSCSAKLIFEAHSTTLGTWNEPWYNEVENKGKPIAVCSFAGFSLPLFGLLPLLLSVVYNIYKQQRLLVWKWDSKPSTTDNNKRNARLLSYMKITVLHCCYGFFWKPEHICLYVWLLYILI